MAGEAESGGTKTTAAPRRQRRWLDAWERWLGPFNRVVALALMLVVAASAVFVVKDGLARLGTPDPRAAGQAVKDSPLWPATRDDLRARVTGSAAAQSETTLRVPATFLVAYDAEVAAVDRRAGGVGQDFLLLLERDPEAPIEYHLQRATASWRRAELGASLLTALALVVFLAVVGWPPREDAGPTAQDTEALLLEDLRHTESRAAFFESRALALLAIGIAAAICGVAGAVYLVLRLPQPVASANTADLVSKLGPVGMLVFVEAVAWFLLRQYRAHVDDFKTTHCIGARRLDFLMALRLLRAPDAEQAKPLVEALLRESPCPGESRGASAPAADESTVEKLVEAVVRKLVRLRKVLLPVALVALPALGQQPAAMQPSANRVTIESPRTGAVVAGSQVNVSGRYSADVKEDIWVLVWPEQAPGKGWPQSLDAKRGVPASKEPGGQWLVGCTLGGPPQAYGIRVYTATRPASDRLGKLLREWARKNDYPGLLTPDLPQGLKERARITIHRDK